MYKPEFTFAFYTKIFFCDPLASWQKAKLEKNHEYIRKVIPKGVILDKYTQKDMIILQNHINCTTRASLNGQSLFELAQLLLDKKLFKAAKLNKIPADKIILNTTLI